jgi:AraC family transcriptional regulator, regulatory protein of adaptative response / methylated-DNA-[protein]-cysteine methyltransferase
MLTDDAIGSAGRCLAVFGRDRPRRTGELTSRARLRDVRNGAVLDPKICDRARIARDPRFDGAFYTGVKTTRIYCRPTCPVKPAQSKNVVFFPTAAAAERAGFRPCLRCRPETAPGTPAWRGAAATVSRALRLIERGFLDGEASVGDLADTLGVTARHLSRLFLRHAGASPVAVATTRRVQRAKTLVDTTEMPMSAVAFASGFASIRRFNSAFRSVYRRSPSAVRRARLRRIGGRDGSKRAGTALGPGRVQGVLAGAVAEPRGSWQSSAGRSRPWQRAH